MLKKDLEATVAILTERNNALIKDNRVLDSECEKLRDCNNKMKMEMSGLKRVVNEVITSIDAIIAIKYPVEHAHDRKFLDRPMYFNENLSERLQIEDCTEEFRTLAYLKTLMIK